VDHIVKSLVQFYYFGTVRLRTISTKDSAYDIVVPDPTRQVRNRSLPSALNSCNKKIEQPAFVLYTFEVYTNLASASICIYIWRRMQNRHMCSLFREQ